MALDIARKLCLTAAAVGAVSRKDLAAAFRRSNALTSFEIERANKWLQGRAKPRDRRVYEEWARLLELDRPGEWIAECEVEVFVERLCALRGIERELLLRRAQAFAGPSVAAREDSARVPDLVGVYVAYSHAWSPYFHGRLIRGALVVAVNQATQRLVANYSEPLPTGRLNVMGLVEISARAMHLDLRDAAGDDRLTFCLFPPSRPTSVLAGMMLGATSVGPAAQPSTTRIVLIRLPGPDALAATDDAYLPPEPSLAGDLFDLGLTVANPAQVDARLAAFLDGGTGGGLDQLAATAHEELVGIFDRNWIAAAPAQQTLVD